MAIKSDTRYLLKHKKSGFFVTSATGLNTKIENAKLYEVNQKKNPPEWSDLLATGDYVIIARTETTTVEYEEVPF
jgi:hypothetical protein